MRCESFARKKVFAITTAIQKRHMPLFRECPAQTEGASGAAPASAALSAGLARLAQTVKHGRKQTRHQPGRIDDCPDFMGTTGIRDPNHSRTN